MSKDKGCAPIRTCISCGARKNKNEMIRLVVDHDGLVILDLDGTGRGRGAYICPSIACRRGLQTGNKLGRVFRKDGPIMIHPDINA